MSRFMPHLLFLCCLRRSRVVAYRWHAHKTCLTIVSCTFKFSSSVNLTSAYLKNQEVLEEEVGDALGNGEGEW